MSHYLKEWVGATLQEYQSSGHELDVLAMTPDGTSIYVEVIWSASLQNFYRDMFMIQNSGDLTITHLLSWEPLCKVEISPANPTISRKQLSSYI
jgi:hypothetical protein